MCLAFDFIKFPKDLNLMYAASLIYEYIVNFVAIFIFEISYSFPNYHVLDCNFELEQIKINTYIVP